MCLSKKTILTKKTILAKKAILAKKIIPTIARNLSKRVRSFPASVMLPVICAGLLVAHTAHATTVQFQTVLGNFEVNLYDKTTPKSVENFLAYVKAGAYTNAVVHRAVPGFVVQGGGYKFDTKLPLVDVAENAAVVNEPVYSNKRGTIAMAKLGSNANSATNQWFFNLADNSANLDAQNGGFTVFGQVSTSNDMAIVDAMAALGIFNMGSPLDSIPLIKYTTTDATNKVPVTANNLVLITGIVVLDANVDTAAALTPVKNTSNTPSSGGGSSGGGGGGGSIGWLSLLMLLTLGTMRLYRK